MATPITIVKQFDGAGFKGSVVNSGGIESATPPVVIEGPTATPITEILRPNI
jgi:hypothetical protein